MIPCQPTPCFPVSSQLAPLSMVQPLFLLTWRSCFFCSWCEYPSTLVPGLLSTVLPLLFRPPQGTPEIKLHIYIDDINNITVPSDRLPLCELGRARALSKCGTTSTHLFYIGTDLDEHAIMDNTYLTEQFAHLRFTLLIFIQLLRKGSPLIAILKVIYFIEFFHSKIFILLLRHHLKNKCPLLPHPHLRRPSCSFRRNSCAS
jgi:hypothetical protein